MPHRVEWTDGRPLALVSSLGQNSPLTEWLLIGPFPFEHPGAFYREIPIGRADAVDADPLGCETTVRPREGEEHRNPSVPEGASRWERLSGSAEYNLKERHPGIDSALCYAVTYLKAEKEHTLVLWADDWEVYRNSTVQMLLDGVEVGHGSSPALVRLSPGEHCLMLKIGGGGTRSYAWKISARAGVVQPIADGLGVALVGLPGFWRGPDDAPQAEVEAVLVNVSEKPMLADGVCARLEGSKPGVPLAAVALDPGQAKAVRLVAPLGSLKPGTKAVVAVACGSRSVSEEVTIPALPPPGIIHVMEGFHCDPVWVSDQHHYNLISLENVKMMVDACLVDPGYRAFVHEIDYLKSFLDEYPDYRTALFDLVREGRMNVGSSYSEPNENNCSGEGIVRNLLYGHGFHRHFLGGDPKVYHCWDVFGHAPQLSQILAKSGHIGTLWSKSIIGFPPIFRHMSPDGTILPHVRTYYTWFSHSMDNLRSIIAPLMAEKHSYGWKRHLMVEASDFTPPSAWMIGKTKEMAQSYPKIVMTSAEEFLEGLVHDGARLPLTSRNPSQHHVGTYHTRVELKLSNRMAENTLRAAECWSTFAALMGASYPDRPLDKAWRQVLFGQHHDAITGTPCDVSYLDLMAGYREALGLGREVLQRSTGFIADGVAAPEKGEAVVVFNSLNWRRGGLVSIPKPEGAGPFEVRALNGEVVSSAIVGDALHVLAEDVPGIGYTTLTVHPAFQALEAPGKPAAQNMLENEHWRITLDPERGGGISSLVDKKTGRELIDRTIGVGNDLIAMMIGDNPWEFRTTGDRAFASDFRADVLIEATPIAQMAVITGHIGTLCTYRRTLALRPGRRTIEASVKLCGYAQKGHQFVVTTPIALSGALPIFEDRFGSVVARRGKKKFDYRTSGSARHSECAIFPVYNWMEAGWSAKVDVGGQSELNVGMMGLVIPHDGESEDATEPLHAALGRVGVTTTPFYDDDDVPRRKTLPLEQYGELFYRHLTDDSVPYRRSDISMNAQWMAVSVAGDNAYVAELLERLPGAARERLAAHEATQGWGMIVAQDEKVPEGWPAMPVIILTASSLDALKRAIAKIGDDLDRDAHIRLLKGCDFRPQPGPVEDYGFALLTTGTGAATMEPDGALTLFLGRTSGWAQENIGRALNPEHRDMVFHYGFYGHEGSWREGGVVRAGYEYANPLVAARPSGSSGRPVEGASLPASQSFLSFDAEEAVITAIKPAGNPVLRFESTRSDPRNGIIVRAYDACGRGARGRLRLFGPLSEAHAATLMEEDLATLPVHDGAVEWSLGPFAVETARLVPGGWAGVLKIGTGELGPTAEPMRPIWCRYWMHNVGAHPMGYLPVGVYLDGELPIENRGGQFPTVGHVRVWIVNNHTDRRIGGAAKLTAPDRWSLLPAEVPYDLGPREHGVADVLVAFNQRPRVGLIKARLEHEGQTYQDVLEAGFKTEAHGVATEGGAVRFNGWEIVKEREPEWRVLRDGQDIVVRVRNPWLEPLEVELAIISPMETWGQDAGEYGVSAITPGYAGLTIPGRQGKAVRFRLTYPGKKPPRFWAWAKLMCNGKRDYKPVPGTTA